MELEEIKKIKDPVERALFEAGYLKAQQPNPNALNENTIMYLVFIGFILFFAGVLYLAIKEYRRNNPRIHRIISVR